MQCSTVIHRRQRIDDRIRRIGSFLGRQDSFTHALIVWYGNRKFLCQVGPGPTAAFDMLNAALDGTRWDSDNEPVEANLVPAQFTRQLHKFRRCPLTKSGETPIFPAAKRLSWKKVTGRQEFTASEVQTTGCNSCDAQDS